MQVSPVKQPLDVYFAHSCFHVLLGGYAAGYYSYKVIDIILFLYNSLVTNGNQNSKYTFVENVQWAEVLSADAFSAFEDAGLDDIKVYTIAKQII